MKRFTKLYFISAYIAIFLTLVVFMILAVIEGVQDDQDQKSPLLASSNRSVTTQRNGRNNLLSNARPANNSATYRLPALRTTGNTPNGLDRPGRVRVALIFYAIGEVESLSGKKLIGDGGKSKGYYHIGRAYWQDACKWGGVNWDYDVEVWNPAKCRQVMKWYWECYGATTNKQRASLHCAGPNGYEQYLTGNKKVIDYVQRVINLIRKKTDNEIPNERP